MTTTITPEALDEMNFNTNGDGDWVGYVVEGEPTIYIEFWNDGTPRVFTPAAPGEDVDFPHVTTMERLKMLLDAIKKDDES
jgi:hypothetical protein